MFTETIVKDPGAWTTKLVELDVEEYYGTPLWSSIKQVNGFALEGVNCFKYSLQLPFITVLCNYIYTYAT